jgi:uncharacterized MAPEG superfamily protein
MTIPFICVLVAFVLIYVPKVFLSVAMAKQPGGYDNKHPREQQAKLDGWGKRAHAAHLNTIEAFAPFAASVFVAHLSHANAHFSASLAIAFIGARVVYPFLYMANLDKIRSLVWGLGVAATLGLFVIGFSPA